MPPGELRDFFAQDPELMQAAKQHGKLEADWALPEGGFEWGSFRLTGLGLVGAYALTFAIGVGTLAVAPTVIHAMAGLTRLRTTTGLFTRPDPGINECINRPLL